MFTKRVSSGVNGSEGCILCSEKGFRGVYTLCSGKVTRGVYTKKGSGPEECVQKKVRV